MKMRRKNSASFWVNIIFLIILFIAMIGSFNYSERARLIPLAVCIGVSILILIVLIGEKYSRLIRSFDSSLIDVSSGSSNGKLLSESITMRERDGPGKVAIIFGWLVGFFVLIYLAGFLIAIPISVLTFLKIWSRLPWTKTMVIAAVTWGFIYILFEVIMKVDLFEGILFGGVSPPI